MPKVMLPLAAQPLWLPTENLAAGPWEPVCAPVRLASAAASVSFASIPAQYVMFRLRCEIINDGTADTVTMRLNNDSGAVYPWQYLRASSTTVDAFRNAAQTVIPITLGAAVDANTFMTCDIIIAKPIAGANGIILLSGTRLGNAGDLYYNNLAALWNNTADLINRIDVIKTSGNFAAGSIFILEGSKS